QREDVHVVSAHERPRLAFGGFFVAGPWWAGRPRPSIHRKIEPRATPKCFAISSTENQDSVIARCSTGTDLPRRRYCGTRASGKIGESRAGSVSHMAKNGGWERCSSVAPLSPTSWRFSGGSSSRDATVGRHGGADGRSTKGGCLPPPRTALRPR